jgi:hypothetical protein
VARLSSVDCSSLKRFFYKRALKLRKLGLQEVAIAANIVAMRPHASKSFINHHRHPLTSAVNIPLLRGFSPEAKSDLGSDELSA